MNCNPGDLAIVVGASARPEALGAVVQVLRVYTGSRLPPGWVVEWHGQEAHATDEILRPIRPNEGDDESLSWAGKPEQVTA